jgi:hypothetical protein
MGTLVMGAPLLAGGPPGWALYGALAVGTLIAGALVYRAARDADVSFPDAEPVPVLPCPPRPETRPQSEEEPTTGPTPIPVPIPRVEDEPVRRSCATDHPTVRLCSSLPARYTFSSIQAAFRSIAGTNLRKEKTRPSTSGPCPGVGTHTAVRSGGAYIASIVCCPCCNDTAAGPELATRCGVVSH